MANKKPQTISELFEFYYEDFKPLYSHLQSLNEPPVELFFEVNAAFDHLSRHWRYDLDEKEAVNAACAHLKRGCFDAFKIVLRETVDHYDELCRVDTSLIDNGDFTKGMLKLISEIKSNATTARMAEGDSRDVESWHLAYELWEPVYVDCVKFDQEYFLNEKVEWAKQKQTRGKWGHRLEGVLLSVVAGLIVVYFASWLSCTRTSNVPTLAEDSPATQNAVAPAPQ